MHSNALHAHARADAQEAARRDFLERRLARYQPRFQPRVRAMAERHSRLKDLAASFPALLFALAVPRDAAASDRAIARVIDGASLRDVAGIVGVPLWLRPVMPAALGAAIPKLPDGELFRRQIGNYLPAPEHFSAWVQSVADASLWADQAVALWIARELHRRCRHVQLERLRGVCLWAWYSRHGKAEGLCATATPWGPSLAFEYAARLSYDWVRRVELHLNLADDGVRDMWLTPGVVEGYEFVPLASAAAIAEEAAAMKHCVADYGEAVAHDMSRLWSVRRGGQRIGTLEIGFPTDDPLPSVTQVSAAGNSNVKLEVWVAARRWLNAHDVVSMAYHGRSSGSVPLSRVAWLKLWRSYWLAKRHVPNWLPLSPSRDALFDLRTGGPHPPAQRRRRRRRHLR